MSEKPSSNEARGFIALALLLAGAIGARHLFKGDSDEPEQPEPSSGGGPSDPRQLAVIAARGEIGKSDAAKYWRLVLLSPPPYPHDWCGGFALWALKQGGIAHNVFWKIGLGFAGNLPQTRDPKPGDIAYFDRNQHHALVESVDSDGTVHLINGNGTAGAVSTSTVQPREVTAFFSVEPLIPKQGSV